MLIQAVSARQDKRAQRRKAKAVGEEIAKLVKANLPGYKVRSTGDLEWGVFRGIIRCGGFCWDKVWFPLEIPVDRRAAGFACPIPKKERQLVNVAVCRAIADVKGV